MADKAGRKEVEEFCPVCGNRTEDCVCCPECGHVCILNQGELYCPVCGPVKPKAEEEAPSEQKVQKERKRRRP